MASGAFSGFFNAGIQAGTDGTLGLVAWGWMFIIEGAITVLAGIVAVVMLPNFQSMQIGPNISVPSPDEVGPSGCHPGKRPGHLSIAA